jgi:hypothetical protein
MVAIATFNAHGQTTSTAHIVPPADALKRVFLNCNCEALLRALDGEQAMACSVIYERLKETVFDGDFDRLLEWSRSRPVSLCAHTASRLPPR